MNGTAPFIYVHDGRACLGHVLSRGKEGFEAFDADDKSLGLYSAQALAVAALSEGGHSGP